MTQHPQLQSWEKQGIQFALREVETHQNKSSDTSDDSTNNKEVLVLNKYISITHKNSEYELSQVTDALHSLSVNLVFDCSFIKK